MGTSKHPRALVELSCSNCVLSLGIRPLEHFDEVAQTLHSFSLLAVRAAGR